jgi:hypothetical protein
MKGLASKNFSMRRSDGHCLDGFVAGLADRDAARPTRPNNIDD